jgi:hypothetical protein
LVEQETIIDPNVAANVVIIKLTLLPQLSDIEENNNKPKKEPK